MKDINMIDSCQTQYASNIKFIHKKRHWYCNRQQATPGSHMQNKPFDCSICCLCSHWLFRFSVLHFNKTVNMIPSVRRRGRPKKTLSECVKTDMKMCSLGSIDPLNREAWGLGVRHSSHLLPTPVPGTPAAVQK